MGNVNVSKELPVSAEKVWSVLSDPHTWDQWLTIHAGWLEEPPSELAKGTNLVEKVVMLGMANKLEWVVDKFEPGVALTIAGKGMAGVTSLFAFAIEPNGEASKVTIDATFDGSLIVGALGKAVEKDAQKNLDDSLDKLVVAAS